MHIKMNFKQPLACDKLHVNEEISAVSRTRVLAHLAFNHAYVKIMVIIPLMEFI